MPNATMPPVSERARPVVLDELPPEQRALLNLEAHAATLADPIVAQRVRDDLSAIWHEFWLRDLRDAARAPRATG